MKTIECKYTHIDAICEHPEWVVAYMCDHCGAEGTAEVCSMHYQYYNDYMHGGMTLSCSDCRGNLSFVAQKISTGEEEGFVR
jgi:hypothetical protein